MIFREKGCRNEFLRTFWGGLRMCSQKVRRKNAHGVNLLIFNITNLIFLIRFLRFFRFSRICLTPKFSKYSKDSNWLLITHHSYLFPRYHPDTTPTSCVASAVLLFVAFANCLFNLTASFVDKSPLSCALFISSLKFLMPFK